MRMSQTSVIIKKKRKKHMIKYILNKFFNKKVVKKKNTFTIINENRKAQIKNSITLQNKNERQESCLSKYFENLKGLNLSERNVYSKIF